MACWKYTVRYVHCYWMLVFLLYVLQVTDEASNKTSRTSCIPAVPPISRRQVKMLCHPYVTKQKGYCRHVIGDWLVKKSPEEQRLLESDLERMNVTKGLLHQLYNIKISSGCLTAFNDVYCRWSFPKCDTNTAKLTVQTICRESCEYVYKTCAVELKLATPLLTPSHIMNCSEMAPTNGGESPSCYHTRHSNTETDKLQASECYYGNGFGYRGNMGVTRSGHVCQSWLSQCPHRHYHPLSEYLELVNASNSCRNPGGQGSNGPWCYTTNSSVRWEYCDVEKCPPPAPSRAPTILQVSPRGSNEVYLAWYPVPLPFMHGQLRGFRIFVKNLDAHQRHERYITNITDPSVTSIKLGDLEPLTNYSLSVLAFNENGDGPCSRPAFVQTMPENFISVQFILTLKGEQFDRQLLKKQSPRYQNLASQVKRKVFTILKKPKTKGYRIFHIEISRFSKGSVLVEFYVTAQVLGFLPHWSIVQDITGRMVNPSAGQLDFGSLAVQYLPPPPANLSHSEATANSAKVSWSPPFFHEQYSIKNYTVQYKKANTKMTYYNAVSSNKTNVIVDNLDSETKYLMRVVSVNAYGTSASQPITVKTKSKSTSSNTALIIALSVTVAVIVFTSIIIVVVWRRWSHKRKHLAQTNPPNLFEALGIETTKDWWEMPRDILLIEDQVGSGSFGVVMRAYLTNEDNTNKTLCAVKMLKDNPTERELRDLCNEINLMTLVGDHPNIISLIGACTLNGPPWLVVKYAVNGSLLHYLEDNRETPIYSNLQHLDDRVKIPAERKLGFAYDIAKGMSHLEKKRVVHRDLSARNILLGRNMVAMVSDFGLSRDVYQMGVYESTRAGILPLRWMSPESLETYTYTTESDVWSYGVVLWEIENGGKKPYGMYDGPQILEYLKQGHRLPNKENESTDLEAIMQECWNLNPDQRPTFASLVNKLGQHLERHERRDPDDGYIIDLDNNTGYYDNDEFAHGSDMEGAPHENAGYKDDDENTPEENNATPTSIMATSNA